jgi:hypothetical protein
MQCSRLAQADLTAMIEGARILEKDSYGPKVYLLADGNILKLFRRKRLFRPRCFARIPNGSSTTWPSCSSAAFLP